MVDILMTLVLATHLLAMNVASAGPLVAAGLRWRRDDDVTRRERLARSMCRLSWQGLAAGSLLGALLLLAPNAGLRDALGRFPTSAYWFAGAEILFSAVCIVALEKLSNWPRASLVLALAAASNLLYHFPPLMAVVGELAADPAWVDGELLDRRALLRLWGRPEIVSMWLHFALASLAVAPLAAATINGRQPENKDAQVDSISRRLSLWALAATLLQLPVGLWLLLASDEKARESMLGDDWIASLCLAGGVMAAVGLLQSLAALAWGDDDRRMLRRAGWLTVAIVVLMTAALKSSRGHAESAPHAVGVLR